MRPGEEHLYWRTLDGRVLRVSSMADEHLKNAIQFMRSRGARTVEEVKNDPMAATEFALSKYTASAQKTLAEMLKEKERREKVSPADSPTADVR